MLQLLQLDQYPILNQLKVEEALLRADKGNWCLINQGAPPAIVMGISQDAKEVIDAKKHQENPIPIIRRYSGGGTVVIEPPTVLVTLILNHDQVNVPLFPKDILKWTETLFEPAFSTLSFSLKENDYVIGKKKCGGNAQYFANKRFVHHTSFVWDYSTLHMERLLMPPKMPAYREKRSHSDFLYPLKSHFPTQSALIDQICQALSQTFTLKLTHLESVLYTLNLPHRKATEEIDF